MLSTGDNAAFYSVDMTAMTLGSTDLGLTSALADGPILDTGTSLFYIPTAVEANLISAINSSASTPERSSRSSRLSRTRVGATAAGSDPD